MYCVLFRDLSYHSTYMMSISISLCLSNKETVCCPVPCCVCLDSLVSVWMVLGCLQLGYTVVHAALHFTVLIYLCWPVVSLAMRVIRAPYCSSLLVYHSVDSVTYSCVSVGLTKASVITVFTAGGWLKTNAT